MFFPRKISWLHGVYFRETDTRARLKYYGAGKFELQRLVLPVCVSPEYVVRIPFLSPWNKATMCTTSRDVFAYRQMTPGRRNHARDPPKTTKIP